MKKVKLGDICSITAGGTPLRSNPEYWNNGTIPWIKISDIKGKYTDHADEYITSEGLRNSSAKMLPKGAILYTIFATLGETSILAFEACTNQAIAALVVNNPDDVVTDYLYYFLLSKKQEVKSIGRGVAQNNINLSILKNYEMMIPDIVTQKSIISVLDRVVNIIGYYQNELQILDNLIKARFVEMFGDPVNNEKEWSTKPLDDICRTIVDCPHSTPNYTSEDTGYMCIRTSIVKKNRILWNEIEYIPEDEYKQRIQRKKPEKGDIIYTREGAILGIAAIVDRDCNVALGQRSMLLSPNLDKCTSEFLSVAMNFESFLSTALKGMSGSASPHINVGDIKAFKMILPPLEQQKRFSCFIEQIDKSKFIVQQALDKAQLLFDSLMQKYFGKRGF